MDILRRLTKFYCNWDTLLCPQTADCPLETTELLFCCICFASLLRSTDTHQVNRETNNMRRVAALRFLFVHIAVLWRALRNPTSCWLAKAAASLGLLYLFGPIDLIPHHHWDEIGIVLLGFLSSRALVPAELAREYRRAVDGPVRLPQRPTLWRRVQFTIRIIRSDLANFFLYQYRSSDALLITGKNSGTHWLKFMLSCALARQYRVPRPRYASGKHSDTILGDPRHPPAKPGMPRIVSSHTVPSIVCGWAWLTRMLPHPPVVVLVRDIRAAMASHYLKWRDCMAESFSSYLQGDPSGRRYKADIWWYIRFFNRWGDLVRANPKKILVVRYEDLQADPEVWLREIADHWGLGLDDEAFEEALRFSSRDAIRSQLDPSRTEMVVPHDPAITYLEYRPRDEAFVRNTTRRYLRHDFGYGYIADAERKRRRPSLGQPAETNLR